MSNELTTTKLVRDVCAQFQNTPNRTVAKLLRDQHPHIFASIEQARGIVRRVRGVKGKLLRKVTADKTLFITPSWQVNSMPESDAKPTQPLVLNHSRRVVVMSDLHIPYHDKQAVEAAVAHAAKWKPDTIILNGDVGDFYQTSRHQKDIFKRRLSDELDCIRQFLFWLRKKFPKAQIVYKLGNHETRLERYLQTNAPALLGVDDFHLKSLLRFEELRVDLAEERQLIRVGKLPIYHGHELPQGISSPVNPARGIWMRVQESLMCGHWHRTSEHAERTGISGQISSCWSTGCLCDMAPDYAVVNRWNHGFAAVEVAGDGQFTVHNHKIIHGKVF